MEIGTERDGVRPGIGSKTGSEPGVKPGVEKLEPVGSHDTLKKPLNLQELLDAGAAQLRA